MRTDILERKNEIVQWIDEELTLYEIKSRLQCKYETLKSYLAKMGLNYKGQQNRKGQYKGNSQYKSIEDYLQNSTCIKSHVLKQKLLQFGIKEARCEVCKQTTWNGQPIPLELHHLNGDHFDNTLENLQLICPNCHALCENNSGKAVGNYSNKVKRKSIEINSKVSSTSIDWENRKVLILSSGVNLRQFGWKSIVQKVTGLTRKQVDLTIEHFQDEFKNIIYIRGREAEK